MAEARHRYCCSYEAGRLDTENGACGEFITTFAPVPDKGCAYCPNCGNDSNVQYIGVSESPQSEVIPMLTHQHGQ